jgi:TP901-1 family phage major tail protein
MSAQKGKDLLLKVDGDGLGSFATVAGLRSHTIAFNAETIDVTDAEAADQWRVLLAGGGVRRASIAGSGVFKDAASDATIQGYFFAGTIRDWEVTLPDFGTLTGPFQITTVEFAGEYNGELAYEVALESAGPIAFAAA